MHLFHVHRLSKNPAGATKLKTDHRSPIHIHAQETSIWKPKKKCENQVTENHTPATLPAGEQSVLKQRSGEPGRRLLSSKQPTGHCIPKLIGCVNPKEENVQRNILETFLAQISPSEFIKLPSGFQSVMRNA